MADVPLIANLEGDLMLANRVELLVGSTDAKTTGDDRLVAMRELSLDISHPESRFNHGNIRSYGHGAPDIMLNFVLSATHDVIGYLRTRGLRNATTGVIPKYKYAVKATSNDGTAKTITFDGKLTAKRYVKSLGAQSEPADISCTVRVIDESEPAAT